MGSIAAKEALKTSAKSLVHCLPRGWERGLRRLYYRKRSIEPEILKLEEWCPADRMAIDIGANRGDYALFLSQIASEVQCFEPNPGLVQELKRLLEGVPATIHQVGLGDECGQFELSIPSVDGKELHGWAGVDRDFSGASWKGMPIVEVKKEIIEVKRLDDFAFNNVGFIKIDVEGHEFATLKGAEALLRRDHPTLLVEIEQRHHDSPITGIFEWLEALGYSGSFLDDDVLRPLTEFDISVHQASPETRSYRNNFLFRAAN